MAILLVPVHDMILLHTHFQRLFSEGKNIIEIFFRTGFPSNLCPQPGHCLDPHNWCSSSFASMRSELLTELKLLILLIVTCAISLDQTRCLQILLQLPFYTTLHNLACPTLFSILQKNPIQDPIQIHQNTKFSKMNRGSWMNKA